MTDRGGAKSATRRGRNASKQSAVRCYIRRSSFAINQAGNNEADWAKIFSPLELEIPAWDPIITTADESPRQDLTQRYDMYDSVTSPSSYLSCSGQILFLAHSKAFTFALGLSATMRSKRQFCMPNNERDTRPHYKIRKGKQPLHY